MKRVEGACHCGAVKFTADINPDKVFVCHCTDCQTLSGSPFRVVAIAPGETLHWVGAEPKHYVKVAASGNPRVQAFCENCGTPIYSSDDVARPAVFALRVGCLKQRDELKPVAQMWCRSTTGWLEAVLDLPGFDEQAS